MPISVPLSDWGARVRAQVQAWASRWPTFSWGTYPGHEPTEALATDGMVPRWATVLGRSFGQKVADLIWAERDDNGVWYVIFYGRIISTTRPAKGWLPYFARNDPNPSKSHKNHVHVSWHKDSDAPAVETAPTPTPAPTPAQPATPEPAPFTDGWVPDLPWVFYLDKQADGVGTDEGSESVWLLQKALGVKPYDGVYRADVLHPLVAARQKAFGNSPKYRDGILGPRDAKKLFGKHVAVKASSK